MIKKKTIVISIGGSLIIPKEVDLKFIENLRKTLERFYNKYKFVIVCGGGSTARKYIKPLRDYGESTIVQSALGIEATRLNAKFLMKIFGKQEANDTLPLDMKSVKNNLSKNSVVISGALRFAPKQTTDTTAAKLSHYLKTKFINLTNVSGLYSSDPKKNKNAHLIRKISWEDFQKIASKIRFSAGQHFVLDQKAAKIIKQHKISTYIISGKDLKQLKNILQNKAFKGTLIKG